MTDHVHEGETGDAPDTFDDRMAVIERMIDAMGEEVSIERRRHRQAVIMRLIGRTGHDALARIRDALDRLEIV